MLLESIRWMATMLLLIVFFGKNLFKEFKTIYAHWRYLFLMGTAGFTGFTTLIYLGAHSTTAVNIGIIQGAMPALVLLEVICFLRPQSL